MRRGKQDLTARTLTPLILELASNRCVFVVSSLAGIVLKLLRVIYPAKASAATRDAKCLGAGRERVAVHEYIQAA